MAEQEQVTNEQNMDVVYFVSYYSSMGMGNIDVTISGFISGIEVVGEVEKLIEEQEGLRDVKIINFIPLREELPQEQVQGE